MSSIFDRLQKELDIRKREEGISPLDIADLPPDLRKVMRLMLREVVMKHSEITAAAAAMPESRRLSPEALDAALARLVEQNWLNRYGSGEFTSYRVNLRRKAGSSLGKDVWSALDHRIAGRQPGDPKPGSDPDEKNKIDELKNKP